MEINSPAASFAVTASELLMSGQAEEALQLSADGVRTFPDYVGGYVLLARAYQAIGYIEDAQVILTEAQRRFPWYNLNASILELEQREQAEFPSELPVSDEPTAESSAEQQLNAGSNGSTAEATEVQKQVPAARPEIAGPFSQHSPLRMIEMAQPTSDTRIIRSSSVRLIPGLEHTSLTIQQHGLRTKRSPLVLPEISPMRRFDAPRPKPLVQPEPRVEPAEQTQAADPKVTSFEELAERISKARISADDLVDKRPAPDPTAEHRQRVVTETLANIYMSQKNYTKAIESFRILKQSKPDQAAKFEARIQECLKLDAAE